MSARVLARITPQCPWGIDYFELAVNDARAALRAMQQRAETPSARTLPAEGYPTRHAEHCSKPNNDQADGFRGGC
jgi:hypothetical protein